MKIRPNQYYLTRVGDIVGPIRRNTRAFDAVWIGSVNGKDSRWYAGGYSMPDKSFSNNDLISHYPSGVCTPYKISQPSVPIPDVYGVVVFCDFSTRKAAQEYAEHLSKVTGITCGDTWYDTNN